MVVPSNLIPVEHSGVTMVARASEVLQGLQSSATRLSSLKKLKNMVIGNTHRKRAFLEAGAIKEVVNLLTSADHTDKELMIQSTATLGSLSCLGGPGVQAILDTCGLEAILNVLVHASDHRVQEAAVRSVKMIYESGTVPPDPILQPQVLTCMMQLLKSQHPGLQEAAAAILCRCGHSPDQQSALTAAGITPALLELLTCTTATARTKALELLAMVLSDNAKAAQQLLQIPTGVHQLQALLKSSCPSTRILAADCIAHLVATCIHHSSAMAGSGTSQAVGPASISGGGAACKVKHTTHTPGKDAANSAGAGSSMLMAASSGACRVSNTARMTSAGIMAWPSPPDHSPPPPSSASQAGVSGAAPSTAGSGSTSWAAPPGTSQMLCSARRAALPVVLRLLSHTSVIHRAPAILATLMEDDEELQQAAVDADAVRQLCNLLSQQPTLSDPAGRLAAREGALKSLGFLCMSRDEARKQLTEPRVLSEVQSSLSEPHSSGVRAAAALCVTALSRNVRTLRCNVLGEDMARALTRLLLADTCPLVQVNASAALCNLVLEFSSVKEAVLQEGVLDRLAGNTSSSLPLLRLYSCWAIRNLAHKRHGATKQAIMQALGWPRMRSLLTDVHEGVQEQAVCILRNLCMDAPEHISAAFQWGGTDLLVALEEKLDPCRPVASQLRVHALYTIVNSLTGCDGIKDEVMSSNLPALLLNHLRNSQDAEVRIAAVWCIINLTWPGPEGPTPLSSNTTSTSSSATAFTSAVEGRLKRLRTLGAHTSLQALLADPNQDVRERAKTALENMKVT